MYLILNYEVHKDSSGTIHRNIVEIFDKYGWEKYTKAGPHSFYFYSLGDQVGKETAEREGSELEFILDIIEEKEQEIIAELEQKGIPRESSVEFLITVYPFPELSSQSFPG